MYNIIRFYNKNRKSIWRLVVIIASAILLLQVLNNIQKNKAEKEAIIEQEVITKSDIAEIKSEMSAITNEIIPTNTLNQQTQTITTFMEKCSKQKIEEAYNMLTTECKEAQYSNINDFKKYYCEIYFKEPRATFEIENWMGSTYKIDIVPDMLSSGKTNESKINQDYITVVKEDGEYKLNVNSYIGRTEINREEEKNNIQIKINYKDVYMDYEKYNITAKNKNNKTICLDPKEDVNTMYLKDKNNLKYSAITNEITKRELTVESLKEKTIGIKYYNKYSSSKSISGLVFSNIVLDYDRYEKEGESKTTIISLKL